MFASLVVVSFLIAFAWLQQKFFDQLMAKDLEAFKDTKPKPPHHPSDPKLP